MFSLASADTTPAVIPLAWTRADEDSRYTKLDLMDERSVEDFFSAQKVDGEYKKDGMGADRDLSGHSL